MSDEPDFGDVAENSKRLLQWIIQSGVMPDPGENLGLIRVQAFDVETDAIIISSDIKGGGWACSVVGLIVTPDMMDKIVMPGTYTFVPPEGEIRDHVD